MKRLSILTWLTALLLTLSLVGPFSSRTAAQENNPDGTPTAESTEQAVSEDTAETQTDEPAPTSENTTDLATATTDANATDQPDESTVVATESIPAEATEQTDIPSDEAGALATPTEASQPDDSAVEPSDEPITTGTITVLSQDQSARPVAGVGFTLFATDGGACTDTEVAPEQITDDNGVTIFLGLDPATAYCVTETTTPTGYLAADPSTQIVSPGDEADGPLDTFVTFHNQKQEVDEPLQSGTVQVFGYLCTPDNIAEQRATIDVSYVDTGALVNVADTTSCQAGTIWFDVLRSGADEGETVGYGTSDGGAFVVTDLETGEYLIRISSPVTTDWASFSVLESGVTTIVLKTFDYGTHLAVILSDNRGHAVPGAGFTIFDESCTTALSQEQIMKRFSLLFEDLPLGPVCIVETTIPPGFNGADPRIFTLTTDGLNQVGFINTPKPVGTVKVLKNDQFGQAVEGAGFTVYSRSCDGDPVRTEQFTDQNGVTIFLDLDPQTVYCVKETTVPTGYQGASPDYQYPDFLNRDVSVVDDVLWFFNKREDGGTSPEAGTVTLLKYYCPVTDVVDERVAFDIFYLTSGKAQAAEAATTTGCVAGAADFEIIPFGTGEPISVSTNASGSLVLTDLPFGEHLIREVAPNASGTVAFEVPSNGIATIAVQNFRVPPPETGTVEIVKYYCPADTADTTIRVSDPNGAADLTGVTSDCSKGDADFTIQPFGNDQIDPISVSTGEDGTIAIDLPATSGETGQHRLIEKASGESANFSVQASETTSITVINRYVKHAPATVTPTAETTKLPVTGVGPTSQGGQGWLVLTGLLALISLIAFSKLHADRHHN